MSETPDLGPTYGAFLLAAFACVFLFGVASLQAYLYFHWYTNDHLWHRLSVVCLWCMDALATCLLVHAMYHYLISGFGDYDGLARSTWSVNLHITISLITAPVVQSLYGLRAWKQRNGSKITAIVLPIGLTAIWSLALDLGSQGWRHNRTISETIVREKGEIYAYFSVCSFVDIVTTFAMCCSLYKPQKTFTLTKSLVRNLILWVIGTGLLTCCIAVAVIIVFAAMPTNMIFLCIAFIMARLHINGFLTMLNIRRDLHHTGSKQVMMLPTLTSPTTVTRPDVPIAIHITHQKESNWASQVDGSPPCKDGEETQSDV